MKKYNNVPIISADDDCLYLYNYADELYGNWIKHKNAVFYLQKVCATFAYISAWSSHNISTRHY